MTVVQQVICDGCGEVIDTTQPFVRVVSPPDAAVMAYDYHPEHVPADPLEPPEKGSE